MKINLPLTEAIIKELKTGDEVYLTGILFTARDQAHKRLVELLVRGEELPINLKNQTIYYTGPAPTPEGEIIGSCGPTTASRMDPFTPALLNYGLQGMIGKGDRSYEVVKAIKKNKAVYLHAYGGCGALYADKINKKEIVAFKDLGPEGIYRLEVEDFPVIVAIDCKGNNIYNY